MKIALDPPVEGISLPDPISRESYRVLVLALAAKGYEPLALTTTRKVVRVLRSGMTPKRRYDESPVKVPIRLLADGDEDLMGFDAVLHLQEVSTDAAI